MKFKEPENKKTILSKKCPSCELIKDLLCFQKTVHTKSGYQSWCKECTNTQTLIRHHKKMQDTDYREKRRQRSLEMRYVYKYGITLQEKIEMIATQKNKCKMCEKVLSYESSVVDHNHESGSVRAILCVKCNTGLSYVENKKFLESAKEYLKNYET